MSFAFDQWFEENALQATNPGDRVKVKNWLMSEGITTKDALVGLEKNYFPEDWNLGVKLALLTAIKPLKDHYENFHSSLDMTVPDFSGLKVSDNPPLPNPHQYDSCDQLMTEYLEEDEKKSTMERTESHSELYNTIQSIWNNRGKFKSSLFVVNSTGSGKTYACIKLCAKLKCLYILCASRGGYKSTAEANQFMRAIQEAPELTEKNAVAVSFIRMLEKVLSETDQENLYQEQFNGNKYKGITKLLKKTLKEEKFESVLSRKILSPESMKRLGSICKQEDMDNVKRVHFSESISSKPDGEKATGGPLAVIFDEADGLLGGMDISNESCPLRCLQRALTTCDIIGVFLCTSARINLIEYNKESNRSHDQRKSNDPFINIINHDLFTSHPFFLGRPLWYKYFRHTADEDFKLLSSFTKNKLLAGTAAADNNTKIKISCSLFCLRFGFEPTSNACLDFVANNLAVMTHLKAIGEGHVAICKWFSEPILSEISAGLTMGIIESDYTIGTVVSNVKNELNHNNIIRRSPGDRGEVVVAAMLGYSLDVLRSIKHKNDYDVSNLQKSMSSNINAKDFLFAIGVDPCPTGTEDYYLNFTHFIRVDSALTLNSCYQAVSRHAAFYVKAGAKSVDIVLVAFKKGSDGQLQFMPIRVQVKNLKSCISKPLASILLHNMSPIMLCQPCLLIENSPLQIGIVVAVGAGGVSFDEVCIINPSTERKSPRTTSKTTNETLPYFGFVLDVNQHFSVLREFAKNQSVPSGFLSDLLEIAAGCAESELFSLSEGLEDHIQDINTSSGRKNLASFYFPDM